MARTAKVAAARAAVERLAGAALDPESFRREAVRCLHRTVGFDGWCCSLFDPVSKLPYWPVAEGNTALCRAQQRFFQIEFHEPDFNKLRDLATGLTRTGLLSQATDHQLRRSARWREILAPLGVGDELRAALVADGLCWGHLTLFRESSARPFGPGDAEILQRTGAAIARGLRRVHLLDGRAARPEITGPATLILDEDFNIVATTDGSRRWLRQRAGSAHSVLPPELYALVAQLPRCCPGDGDLPGARAPRLITRTPDGHWEALQAARLAGPSSRDAGAVAITIDRPRAGEILPHLAHAHGLTPRECEVTQAVLDGLSVRQVARRLAITTRTAQDHLKAVYAKLEVHSRTELQALLRGD